MSLSRQAPRVVTYDSAYAGSMCVRPGGGYVRINDGNSLAGALLALVEAGERAASDMAGALKQAQAQRDCLLSALQRIERQTAHFDAISVMGFLHEIAREAIANLPEAV